METYKFRNAIINVHGEVDKEKLKNATIKLLRKSYKYKKLKEEKKS